METQVNKPKTKINLKTLVVEILTVLLGTFVTAAGFQIFLTPHNIVPGGFMGVAKIIYDVIARTGFTGIPISVWYILINAALYIYAVKCLGWKFALLAGIGISSYSVFVEVIQAVGIVDIITNQFVTDEATSYILYAIYGGLLMGAGIGLVFRGNGSTGGCDMLALVVNRFFPTITTGQLIIIVDGIVVILSAIVYSSLVLPLYALITIFICGKVSDMFVDGIASLRAYYIITNKKEEISEEILSKLNRGVTNIKCEGMFTHEDRNMLLVVVRRAQVLALKRIVKSVDETSFMFSSNIKEAYGKGFITYTDTSKKKPLINIKKKPKQENELNSNNEQLSKETSSTQNVETIEKSTTKKTKEKKEKQETKVTK